MPLNFTNANFGHLFLNRECKSLLSDCGVPIMLLPEEALLLVLQLLLDERVLHDGLRVHDQLLWGGHSRQRRARVGSALKHGGGGGGEYTIREILQHRQLVLEHNLKVFCRGGATIYFNFVTM